MKVTELLEGTWALPDTEGKLERLNRLLDAPIPGPGPRRGAADRLQKIYRLIGDDDVDDDLWKAINAGSKDLRPVLLKHLPRLLDTRTWVDRPDSDVEFEIHLLKKKVKKLQRELGVSDA